PTMCDGRGYVEAGLLISYGPNLPDLWLRAAGYIDKLLKGARAADLPIEQPTKFELVINLKTAKALGLTIPPSLLLRADQLIQSPHADATPTNPEQLPPHLVTPKSRQLTKHASEQAAKVYIARRAKPFGGARPRQADVHAGRAVRPGGAS